MEAIQDTGAATEYNWGHQEKGHLELLQRVARMTGLVFKAEGTVSEGFVCMWFLLQWLLVSVSVYSSSGSHLVYTCGRRFLPTHLSTGALVDCRGVVTSTAGNT